jgi:hypothetical protein
LQSFPNLGGGVDNSILWLSFIQQKHSSFVHRYLRKRWEHISEFLTIKQFPSFEILFPFFRLSKLLSPEFLSLFHIVVWHNPPSLSLSKISPRWILKNIWNRNWFWPLQLGFKFFHITGKMWRDRLSRLSTGGQIVFVLRNAPFRCAKVLNFSKCHLSNRISASDRPSAIMSNAHRYDVFAALPVVILRDILWNSNLTI